MIVVLSILLCVFLLLKSRLNNISTLPPGVINLFYVVLILDEILTIALLRDYHLICELIDTPPYLQLVSHPGYTTQLNRRPVISFVKC